MCWFDWSLLTVLLACMRCVVWCRVCYDIYVCVYDGVVSAEVNLACSLPPVTCVTPPAAPSRTLQWDTDPSVLRLQADSELGYLLLCLFLSFFLLRSAKLLNAYTYTYTYTFKCTNIFQQICTCISLDSYWLHSVQGCMN